MESAKHPQKKMSTMKKKRKAMPIKGMPNEKQMQKTMIDTFHKAAGMMNN